MGSSPSSPAMPIYKFTIMMNRLLLLLLFFSVSSLAYVLYEQSFSNQLKDTSKLEARMKALNEELSLLTDKYKSLKSSLPVPVETQLEQISSKITQLDNAVTDHSDLLKKMDPNGLIMDTENWISEMYENANNDEQNKWSRLESAEVLDRFNRMDQDTVDEISEIYLNEEDGRGSGWIKARALGSIADMEVSDGVKDKMFEDLKGLYNEETGEYGNDWYVDSILRNLENQTFTYTPEQMEIVYELIESHQNPTVANRFAAVVGVEVSE